MPLLSELYSAELDLPEIEITGITSDSRLVKPGYLFFAIKGAATDGHKYIKQVVDAGAAAVIGENPAIILPVPYFSSKNIRHDLAIAATKFYKNKPQKIALV